MINDLPSSSRVGYAPGRPRPAIALVAAACVLAGGLAMRYCVVEAGMHPLLAMAS